MNAFLLSRLQFAASTMFHFLFIPLTLGLSLMVAYMETKYVKTGDETYLSMTKFWGQLFLINFALGVVTGITLEFQFGTNWSRYSTYVGDIFGSLLAIEAAVAFFLESTLIGVWIFGWKKLSKKTHALVMWLVAGASTLSAIWILTANAWMQHPVGYTIRNGRAELTDFAAVVFQKFAILEFIHTVSGTYTFSAFFGITFANIFRGIPIDGNGIYHGTLLTLLNPYGIAGGVLFILLFLLHGALWAAIRTEGDLHNRVVQTAKGVWPLLLAVTLIFLAATWFATPLYGNYFAHPALFLVVSITVAALLAVRLFLGKACYFKAWFASALTIIGTTFFGVIGLFPNMIPSSIDPRFNLTAFNSSSSPLTLKIMLVVALIFVPIVLLYQTWAYNLFKGKITPEDLAGEEAY